MATAKMSDDTFVSNIEDIRLQFYKTTLNLLRSRRLALEANQSVLLGNAENVNLSTCEDGLAVVHHQVNEMHLHLSLLLSACKGLSVMTNSLDSSQNEDPANSQEIVQLVAKVSELTKALQPYDLSTDEAIFAAKLNFSEEFTKLRKQLQKNETEEKKKMASDVNRLATEKLERTIRKINVTRVLSRRFVAAFFNRCKSDCRMDEFLTPFRRRLTIEDFKETWDIGIR